MRTASPPRGASEGRIVESRAYSSVLYVLARAALRWRDAPLVRGRVRGARVSGGARGARGAIARVHVCCAAVSAPRGEFARDGVATRLHGRYCIIASNCILFLSEKYLLLVLFR